MLQRLLLTTGEQDALQKRCASLLDSSEYSVVLEDLESFETPEQMTYRLEHCALKKSLGFDMIAAQLATPEAVHNVDFSSLSPDDLHHLFSMIGAVGVSAFIELGIQTCTDFQDLSAIASLTNARHALLLSNKEFFTPSAHGN